MHDVVGLVRKLVSSLIRDQDTFYWVKVDKALVLGQLSSMHLAHVSFQSDQRVKCLVNIIAFQTTVL